MKRHSHRSKKSHLFLLTAHNVEYMIIRLLQSRHQYDIYLFNSSSCDCCNLQHSKFLGNLACLGFFSCATRSRFKDMKSKYFFTSLTNPKLSQVCCKINKVFTWCIFRVSDSKCSQWVKNDCCCSSHLLGIHLKEDKNKDCQRAPREFTPPQNCEIGAINFIHQMVQCTILIKDSTMCAPPKTNI